MATSPKVLTADVITDHPVLNLLSAGAKNAVTDALKSLFAQATCSYAKIPCPRNLELWPPPSRDPLEAPSTSKAAQSSKIQADRIAFVREGLSGQFAYGTSAIQASSPVIFEGKEFFVIEQPSPDIVILSTMESAEAITRARGVALVPSAPPAPPLRLTSQAVGRLQHHPRRQSTCPLTSVGGFTVRFRAVAIGGSLYSSARGLKSVPLRSAVARFFLETTGSNI